MCGRLPVPDRRLAGTLGPRLQAPIGESAGHVLLNYYHAVAAVLGERQLERQVALTVEPDSARAVIVGKDESVFLNICRRGLRRG